MDLDSSSSRPKSFQEQEIQILKAENQKLKLRILGVSELTRILNDRDQLVKILEEKNKRLEVAVIRLEGRCSNFERKLKTQAGNAGPRPGQSPFIPGPSRQILEALMKENSELKKTINNLMRKGATSAGYLEAVKVTQLEEVIDEQKSEIAFLQDQINSLTGSGVSGTPKDENSISDPSIMENSASPEVGALRKQLIKLRRSMKVKDRFCTLLGQEVTKLQDKLAKQEKQGGGQEGGEVKEETDNEVSKEHQEKREDLLKGKDKMLEDAERLLAEEKQNLKEQLKKMESLEAKLKDSEDKLSFQNLRLEEKKKEYEDLANYNRTLVRDKTELSKSLDEMKKEEEKRKSEEQELNSSIMAQLQQEISRKDIEITRLNELVETTQLTYALNESKLSEIGKIHEQEMQDDRNKIEDLESTVSALNTENSNLRAERQQLSIENKSLKANLKHFGRQPQPQQYQHPFPYHQAGTNTPHLIIPGQQLSGSSLTSLHSPGLQDTSSFPYTQSSRRPHTQPLTNRCQTSQVDRPILQTMICRDTTSSNPPQQQTTHGIKPFSHHVSSEGTGGSYAQNYSAAAGYSDAQDFYSAGGAGVGQGQSSASLHRVGGGSRSSNHSHPQTLELSAPASKNRLSPTPVAGGGGGGGRGTLTMAGSTVPNQSYPPAMRRTSSHEYAPSAGAAGGMTPGGHGLLPSATLSSSSYGIPLPKNGGGGAVVTPVSPNRSPSHGIPSTTSAIYGMGTGSYMSGGSSGGSMGMGHLPSSGLYRSSTSPMTSSTTSASSLAAAYTDYAQMASAGGKRGDSLASSGYGSVQDNTSYHSHDSSYFSGLSLHSAPHHSMVGGGGGGGVGGVGSYHPPPTTTTGPLPHTHLPPAPPPPSSSTPHPHQQYLPHDYGSHPHN